MTGSLEERARPRSWHAGEWIGRLVPHMRETVVLAIPVMLARAGILTMFVADSIMTGQLGKEELGFLGLGLTLQMLLMLIAIGMLQGSIVLIAQAVGAREEQKSGQIWRIAALHAFGLGLLFALVSFGTEDVLRFLGQDNELAAGAGDVARMFAIGMPGMLLYIACGYLLEGIGRPQVGMWIMAAANLLNIALNTIFIWGWGGLLPAMGAEGAVLSTSLIRWMMSAAALTYILLRLDWRRFGIGLDFRDAFNPEGRALGRRLRRLGMPMGLAQAVETAAFQSIVLMAGLLGSAALAAHHVTMTYIQVIYMVAIGVAAATSIRVGRAVGRDDSEGAGLAGFAGLLVVAAIMILPMLCFGFMPGVMARFFIADREVLEIARATLFLTAFLVVFDGTMAVAMGALRGTGDVWVPLGLHGAVFWGLGVPIAYGFAFPLGLGPSGLIIGILAAVMASTLLLTWRFRFVTRGGIGRA